MELAYNLNNIKKINDLHLAANSPSQRGGMADSAVGFAKRGQHGRERRDGGQFVGPNRLRHSRGGNRFG